MKLQKIMLAGNRLPEPDARTVFVKHDAQVAERYDDVAARLRGVCDEITNLQHALLRSNPSLCESATPTVGKKRLLDTTDLPDDPIKLHEHILPFLDPVIDKWQTKTQIASGGSAPKKFRALNQVRFSMVLRM